MRSITAAALAAVAVFAAPSIAARGDTERDARRAETPTVHHAGGRHDQRAHDAAVRARANGHTLEPAPFHAGGRHDPRAHEAAIRADQRREAERDVR